MLINRKNAIIYFYNREVLPVLSTLILFPFDTTTEVNKKKHARTLDILTGI